MIILGSRERQRPDGITHWIVGSTTRLTCLTVFVRGAPSQQRGSINAGVTAPKQGSAEHQGQSSHGGNIAVTFAIALVPVLAALGCAVDYSLANSASAKLQACADTAVVAAVSQQGMTQTAANAQTAMVNWFNGICATSASSLSQVTISNVSAMATDTNGARVAAMTFRAARTNSFLSAVGFPTTNIGGSAKTASSSAGTSYVDIYALLDDSPSMGLGATVADQTKLTSLTPMNCQFGCHETGAGAASPDNYTIAKNNGVQMRIDVMRNSWINLINQANNGSSGFRFATYTFDTTVNQVQPLTSSAATALASANNIDLMAVDFSGGGSTYALQSMATNIPSAGDGSSTANSKKYLILVTDGVQDFDNCSYILCHQPQIVTASSCTALKNKGINVAVIYTTYLPFNSIFYTSEVQPLANNIAPALQSCATSGLYFEASDATGIASAFSSIFSQIAIASNPRLTN
jgi:Flp pilus assembly protein TadG